MELFRSMEIPVRQLNCCSGDLADLKVKSCDIEAWSPRQQKYFEEMCIRDRRSTDGEVDEGGQNLCTTSQSPAATSPLIGEPLVER